MATPRPSPDAEGLEDEALVRRCQAADGAAWAELVRRYQRLVYTIPRRAGLDEAAAADVFQLAFSRLHQHIGSLQDGSRVRAWLVTTARRETLRELKRAGRVAATTVSFDAVPESADDDEGAGGGDEERAGHPFAEIAASSGDLGEEARWHAVQMAVERMEPRCRELIRMLFLTEPEPSYAEIGRQLGLPIGSIGPTRGRCLARLRKGLGDV